MSERTEKRGATKAACLAMLLALGAPAAAMAADTAAHPMGANGKTIERGRYLVKIGGCNDCHTAGYAQSGGQVPEKDWLMGDRLGYRGPWGTTYAANLRMTMASLGEDDWVKTAKTVKMRPPMPWFTLRDMSNDDLRAIYRFVRHLKPAGNAAPAYVPPDQTPPMPFVQFPAPPQ
jgi:mono/diheme cytochrome c family protein